MGGCEEPRPLLSVRRSQLELLVSLLVQVRGASGTHPPIGALTLACELLLLLRVRGGHLVDRVALPLPYAVHAEQVDLEVLLGLELLGAQVAGYVLGLHRVDVNYVLLEIRVVGVYLPALRALGLALEAVAGVHLERVEHSELLDLLLGAGLQHKTQLV